MTDVLSTVHTVLSLSHEHQFPVFGRIPRAWKRTLGGSLNSPPNPGLEASKVSLTRGRWSSLVHCSARFLRNTVSDWPPAPLVLWLILGRLRGLLK